MTDADLNLEQAIYDAVTLIHLMGAQLSVRLEGEHATKGGDYASGVISIAHQTENRLLAAYKHLQVERRMETAADLDPVHMEESTRRAQSGIRGKSARRRTSKL